MIGGKHRKTKAEQAPVEWVKACDSRSILEHLAYFTKWDLDSLSPSERTWLRGYQQHLEAAHDNLLRLQGGLATRSKAAGHRNPAYDRVTRHFIREGVVNHDPR